jgi:hypothetical protein
MIGARLRASPAETRAAALRRSARPQQFSMQGSNQEIARPGLSFYAALLH